MAIPAGATPAPRLRGLLKAARVVVAGQVVSVTPYDSDRVEVVEFAVERVLKGNLPADEAQRVALVEVRDSPTRTDLTVGARGIAFVRPATRTSSLAQLLPAGSYFQLLPQYGAFLEAATAADAERQTALVARVVKATRGAGLDGAGARQLTFDLLTTANPLLVEDGSTGLADLGQHPELTAPELAMLRAALLRAALPDRVRVTLIGAVAKAGLRDAVPALQSIDAPPAVAEAAWQALDQLGAAPPEESLETRLTDRQPEVRAAAARELLRREGVDAVGRVAPLAMRDPDPDVQRAAVDALGALGKPEALPPLERVFVDSPTDLQQATGRAILAVGGPPAIDAFGRLAFTGPVPSQRYAVVLLMTMTDPHRDEVLQRIAQTHSDEDIRELIEHGLPQHHH
jgi:hypothetical protein